MTALPATSSAPDDFGSKFFWIKRDRSSFARCVRGSISMWVPPEKQRVVLSAEFEDWCLDNLTDGALLEWRGMDLYIHFAIKADGMLFQLKWR